MMICTVAQEVIPLFLELDSFTKVGELGGQDGLDVVLVGRHDQSLAHCPRLNRIRAGRVAILAEDIEPELEGFVFPGSDHGIDDEIYTPRRP